MWNWDNLAIRINDDNDKLIVSFDKSRATGERLIVIEDKPFANRIVMTVEEAARVALVLKVACERIIEEETAS